MMDKDRTANFIGIVENNKGIRLKLANSYCRNIEDRKYLVQEIILQLWKSFDNYNEKFKLSTWISNFIECGYFIL